MSAIFIGGAALNQTPIDWDNNTNNIRSAIALAKAQNVAILGLPELCITGYGCEDLFLSDWLYESAWNELQTIRQYCDDICVIVGLPFKWNNARYNAIAIVENQEIKGLYLKQNLANDGIHYEARWFSPWPSEKIDTFTFSGKSIPIGDIQYQYQDFHIGFEICEDAWIDNRPACKLKEKNVDLIINPSASHFAMEKAKDRIALVENSSRDFNCAYLYVNVLGNEAGRIIYDGDVILAQHGNLLADAPRLTLKEINFTGATIQKHHTPEPISPTLAQDANTDFLNATTLGLFDYLRKTRSNCYLLSLSGGADSATCAVLVAQMVVRGLEELGSTEFKKKLHLETSSSDAKSLTAQLLITAYQGSKNSSSTTLEAAKTLADFLGATFFNWYIDTEVEQAINDIAQAIDRPLNWEKDDIALQNIQARVRSPKIWLLTNVFGGLLLTTSNRSEGDVGYATMDGDTSGGLAPIAGVDKPFIRKWLKWAEKHLKYHGLALVNQQAPTAELRPPGEAQEDEKDLMPYAIMKCIEVECIGKKNNLSEVLKALTRDFPEVSIAEHIGHIEKFTQLWSRNQWKRERLAPSFHLADFNIDPRSWMRNPILSGGFKRELRQLKAQFIKE